LFLYDTATDFFCHPGARMPADSAVGDAGRAPITRESSVEPNTDFRLGGREPR
jgi:hypothetical protein